MANPEIIQLGNPVLRQAALRVEDFASPDFQALVSALYDCMQEAGGVGIAAPQIGESQQIIIIASRPTSRYPTAPDIPPVVMVNPRFDILDATLHKDWEGCLSVPGIRALVPRYRAINIDYQDEHGRSRKIELHDFPARVFQHEFDHLQGLVYLDRVEDNRDIVAESEFFKLLAA